MAASLRGGLSASLSGIAFWSHDIGGFRGTPSPELYVRWAQFGLLSSHARCHGTTPREPWAFGEEATDLFREYAELRYGLVPYLYTLAEEAARTGIPVVRPLVLEYPEDRRTHDIDTQFLLGEDLLVAPVFEESGERSVYLPEGEWVDHWTGERHAGGRTVERTADLGTLPLYVRAGSVVPGREPTESIEPGTPAELHLRATLADGSAVGEYYDPETDALVEAGVSVADGTADVTVPDVAAERVVVELDAETAVEAVTVDGTPAERDGDRWHLDGGDTSVEVRIGE